MTQCGLSNLATCLPEKFFDYILTILNAPLQPLLNAVNSLMTEPVNVYTFQSLWVIIIYTISMLYGLFLLFAGINFLISGHDAIKRERAKDWLKNIILMIIFVQASFFIYEIIIEMGAILTSSVIGIIDPKFFLLTKDNIINIGLQLLMASFYAITLLLTIVTLALRYLLVAVGVLFFPFALFFYFIPPLKSYGKAIINILLILIFIPFFHALILFAASSLLGVSIFSNFKILLMISAFNLINITTIILILFAILKAANSAAHSEVGKTVKAAVKYIV